MAKWDSIANISSLQDWEVKTVSLYDRWQLSILWVLRVNKGSLMCLMHTIAEEIIDCSRLFCIDCRRHVNRNLLRCWWITSMIIFLRVLMYGMMNRGE